MNNKIKGLVSKKKKRYQKDGFDLDLTYVTNRIIAMGFPAQSFEGIYRNHVDDVVRFFKAKHGKNFRIYNLCNERQIDHEKFDCENINHQFPFNDHNPPMFNQMLACCDDINNYLNQNDENVVAIQCKAGKGRTGVILCACLLLTKFKDTPTSALVYYGRERTTNAKGVTIPSQIRYVYYYDHFITNFHNNEYHDVKLCLKKVYIEDVPLVFGNGNELQAIIYGYENDQPIYRSNFMELKKEQRRVNVPIECSTKGDIKLELLVKNKFGKKEKLCHCWLNTFFVVNKPQITSLQDGLKIPMPQNYTPVTTTSQSATSSPSPLPITTLNPSHHQFYLTKQNSCSCDSSTSHSFSGPPPCPPPSYLNSMPYKITLRKDEIDKANKDTSNKTFPKDFSITFYFAKDEKMRSSSVTTLDKQGPPTSPKSYMYPTTASTFSFKASNNNNNDNNNMYSNIQGLNNNSPEQSDSHSVSSESSTEDTIN